MRTNRERLLPVFIVLALAVLAAGGCARKVEVTTSFQEDGSVVIDNVITASTQTVNTHLEQVEAWRKQSEGAEVEEEEEKVDPDGWGAVDAGEETEADETDAAAADAEAETEDDAEEAEEEAPTLEKRIREAFAWQVEQGGMPGGGKQEIVSVEEDADAESVTVHLRTTFADLRSFVRAAPVFLGQVGFSRLKMEADEEGRLRLEFSTRNAGMVDQMVERTRMQTGGEGFAAAYTFAFPGEVVESGFPETEGSETSFTFDTEDEESLQAYRALLADGVAVVAGAGEFDLAALPLDSMKLNMRPEVSGPMAKLPVEKAEPGLYTAEALGVVTRTVRTFAEAEEALDKQTLQEIRQRGEGAGCTAQVRLYAPAGRKLLGHEGAELIRAVDDQDRPVPEPGDEAGMRYSGHHSGSNENKSVDFRIRLGLPERDAEAIEELEAEAIVHSFAEWKTFRLPDPKADADATHDLGDLIPGATLKVKRVTRGDEDENRREGDIRIEIKGPEGIGQMKVEVKVEGADNVHSYDRHSSHNRSGKTQTIERTIHYNVYSHGDGGKGGPPILVLKYPDEIKRERVRFTVYALDLF